MLFVKEMPIWLQQYLPFTVLKLSSFFHFQTSWNHVVATVPTVYGIETIKIDIQSFSIYLVATVLTVYGIETEP